MKKRKVLIPEMEGLSELFINLQGGTHHKVGYILLNYQNINTNEIEITKAVKEDIADMLKVSTRMIDLSIKELVEANILTLIKRGRYIMNPLFIYIGSTLNLEPRLDYYNEQRKKYQLNKDNE